MSERILVVNADDYGLTDGVSRAVLRAHTEGIVTSTSVLVVAPAFERSAPRLDDVPALGVGAHLAVVGEDPPLLPAHEIPTLVDKEGRFDISWRRFVPRMAAGRVDYDDVRREMAAQLARLAGAVHGRRLTHVDTHQHVHLWPPMAAVVVGLATQWGIPAIRVPSSAARGPVAGTVRRLARRLRHRAAAAGLHHADAFAGFDEGGTLELPALVRTIEQLAATGASTAELGCHPGEHDDAALARYRWGYRWGDELDALVSPGARAAVAASGFTLGTYGDLAAVHPGPS